MTDEENMAIISANPEGARTAMQKFQEIKRVVLDANDTIQMQGKPFIKRSGWRKIALAFNVTTRVLEVAHERDPATEIYIVRVRAIAQAPNGRTAEEWAVCDSSEFTGNLKPSIHNIESKAVTRAINRSISDLVGGGEVSAEEMDQGANTSGKKDWHDDPATKGQKESIRNLVRQQKLSMGDSAIDSLTKGEASELISSVK